MSKFIEIKDVVYQYQILDDDENIEQRNALDGVSLTIEEGEWLSIIGPNGSGKSTLAKTINGLIPPQKGSVQVGAYELNEENIWSIRQMVGMVFQNPDNQFVGSTVQDDVAFGLENLGVPREEMTNGVHKALEKVGMIDFLDKEPSKLSGGQKQRVAIAGIIALQPKVIILDEATSMLDPTGRKEVLQTVREVKKEENLTVLSITHDIDEAASSNRIAIMKDGKIVGQGEPKEIFAFGEKLIELGLDLPFFENLKVQLKKMGIQVPEEYLTEERMIDWLWKYNSKK